MNVDWGSLLGVAVVAAGVAVALVALVASAVVGLSPRRQPPGSAPTRTHVIGTAAALVCLLAAVAIVGYGLVVIAG